MSARIACWILGHVYHVKQRFSDHSRRVECLRCERTWGMNDYTQSFLPWDDEFTRLYELLGHRVIK